MSHAAADPGFLGHIRAFFERDVEPDIIKLKADVSKVRALLPELQVLANTVVTLAKASDVPEVAVIAEDAVKAGEVIAEIATALAATGL